MATSRDSWLSKLLALWRAFPVVMVFLMSLIFALPIWVKMARGEKRALELYYPMSHFPMYSDFTDWEYVIFLADGQGNPLPLEELSSGLRVARVKKNFNSALNQRLDEIKQQTGKKPRKRDTPLPIKQEVGTEVMAYVLEQWQERNPQSLAQQTELRLYLQNITQSQGKVRPGEPQLVAEWSKQN